MSQSSSGPEAWITDPGMPLACLTFTRSRTPGQVLTAYGADPRHAHLADRQEALAVSRAPEKGSVLRAAQLADWTLCLEEDNLLGTMPHVLASLSKDTETLCILRGGDGMHRFAHWRNGAPAEAFEPGMGHTRPPAPHPWWDNIERRAAAGSRQDSTLRYALQAVGDHIGVAVDLRTVTQPMLTLWVPESHEHAVDPPTSDSPGPRRLLGRALPTSDLPAPGRGLGRALPPSE